MTEGPGTEKAHPNLPKGFGVLDFSGAGEASDEVSRFVRTAPSASRYPHGTWMGTFTPPGCPKTMGSWFRAPRAARRCGRFLLAATCTCIFAIACVRSASPALENAPPESPSFSVEKVPLEEPAPASCSSPSDPWSCLADSRTVPPSSRAALRFTELACQSGLKQACDLHAIPRIYHIPDDEERQLLRIACAWENRRACEHLMEECPGEHCTLDSEELPAYRWTRSTTPLSSIEAPGLRARALPGARLLVLRTEEDQAVVLLEQFLRAGRFPMLEDEPTKAWYRAEQEARREPLMVMVPTRALMSASTSSGSLAPPPAASSPHEDRIVAVDHERLLLTQPHERYFAINLNCGEVEVVQEDLVDGRTWQLLRQQTGGVELTGWTHEPILYSWGTGVCDPRAVYIQRLAPRTAVYRDGWKRLGEAPSEDHCSKDPLLLHTCYADAPTPAGYKKVDPAAIQPAIREMEAGTKLYSIEVVQDAALCVERSTAGQHIRYSYTLTDDDGQQTRTVLYSAGYDESGLISLDGPTIESRVGADTTSISLSCAAYTRIVHADEHSIQSLGEYSPVISYHPDDVTHWYRSKNDCEQALAQRPRLRLRDPRERTAQAGLRMVRGC